MTRILTEVETHLDAAGNLRPVAFRYEGQRIQVTSFGRQWDAGNRRHHLVMDRRHRTFELAYNQEENRWDLIQSPHRFGPQRPKAA